MEVWTRAVATNDTSIMNTGMILLNSSINDKTCRSGAVESFHIPCVVHVMNMSYI